MGVPNATTLPDDLFDVQAFTWNLDDSNVSGGSDHRTWTAEEMAVTTLAGHYEYYSGGATPKTLLVAPAAGIFRVVKKKVGAWVKLNGVTLSIPQTEPLVNAAATPVKVLQGDTITGERWDGVIVWWFLPFVWPIL